MARPTKLTDQLAEEIEGYIRDGNLPHISAKAAGIATSTFYSWMDRGRKGVMPYSEFLERIERATGEVELKVVGTLVSIGETKDWRALAWFLERRFPHRWGKTPRNDSNLRAENADTDALEITIAEIETIVRDVLEPGKRHLGEKLNS